jgi:hypothetical protein
MQLLTLPFPMLVHATPEPSPFLCLCAADGTPGPNSYKVRQSMGSQVLSTTPSAGAVPKSTMERSQWSKAYISSSHTKFDSGIDSPGPAYLPETNARGGDTLSLGRTKKNGWSFPKQPQRPSTVASMRSPGPGKPIFPPFYSLIDFLICDADASAHSILI